MAGRRKLPIRRTFWLHIDHINNAEGKVWAVQVTSQRQYLVAHRVIVNVPVETVYRGDRQPRAYLKGRGHIVVRRLSGQSEIYIS